MKTSLFITILVIFCRLPSFSQDLKSRDSISMDGSVMRDMHFYQHGESINMGKLTEILKINPGSYYYLKKAKINNAFNFLLSFTGGFIMGYELGTSLGGKKINWGIMGCGIGAIGLSVPFSIGAKHNIKKALKIYNASLP